MRWSGRNAATGRKAGKTANSDGCRGRDCPFADGRRLVRMLSKFGILAAPQPKGHDRSTDG